MWKKRYDILIAAADRTEQRVLREKARAAQRRKDWRSAELLWRRCWEKAPRDRNASIGYIGILVYLGEWQRARELANEFVHRFPNDENGPVLLGRLAESRGDFAGAVDHWRAALLIEPSHLQALIRLAGATLKLERFEDAEACANRLIARYPAEPHGLIVRAQIIQEKHGFAQARAAWEEATTAFPGDTYVLRAHGRALLAAREWEACLAVARQLRNLDRYESFRLAGQVRTQQRRYDDHTDFWAHACQDLPGNTDLIRQWLNAALWARRLEDAERALESLISQGQLRASDADYVIGLGHAYLANGRYEEIRALVRSFMYRLRKRGGYRTAGLRLSRLVLASFPRASGSGTRISRDYRRFRIMVERAQLGPGATNALTEVANLEEQLACSGAECFFDTDIGRDECLAFIDSVRRRIAGGTPFSFIRLGDAESSALSYEPALVDHFQADAEARERIWWGRTLDPAARSQLARRIRLAVENADGLGIPTRGRLLRDIRLDSDQELRTTSSGRGLLAIFHLLRTPNTLQAQSGLLTSAHVHQDLHRWSLYPALFDGLAPVVLISGHPELADAFAEKFGLPVAKSVLLPPGDAALEMKGRSLEDCELPPYSIERALEALGDWPRGRLVLVGAGYAGKVLVHEAKARGGIALDLGSIFDTWLGLHTRSYQDIA